MFLTCSAHVCIPSIINKKTVTNQHTIRKVLNHTCPSKRKSCSTIRMKKITIKCGIFWLFDELLGFNAESPDIFLRFAFDFCFISRKKHAWWPSQIIFNHFLLLKNTLWTITMQKHKVLFWTTTLCERFRISTLFASTFNDKII